MAARRLIIVMISLLVISSIAAALVPVQDDGEDTTTTSTTTVPQPAPTGNLVRKTVEAGGRTERIRLRAGDQLELRVRVKRPGEIAIPKLGQVVPIDPAAAVNFDLLLDDPGTYPVRLAGADRAIARIQVARRGSK